jgi:fatty acid desaturase
MEKISRAFWHFEGPTWLVGITIYTGWFTLVLNHADLPLPGIVFVGAILVAWHNSLIHESVHNINTVPKWLKMVLVLPPLGIWYPYTYYARAHTIHHREHNLTDPKFDPESYYFTVPRWQRLNSLFRPLFLFNQTFAGRMTIGPIIVIGQLVVNLVTKTLQGDGRIIKGLAVHVPSLAILFWFISSVAGMDWWMYVACIAYPGLALSLVRSFYEHRAADDPAHRTAIIESGMFFNLLFLYNNLHVVHHLDPKMPWYEIPAYYKQHRDDLHRRNGGYVLKGYGQVVRKFLFTPAFYPVHPNS